MNLLIVMTTICVPAYRQIGRLRSPLRLRMTEIIMMMLKRLRIVLLLGAFVLIGCTARPSEVAAGGAPRAWIDAPLNGSSLPLGQVDLVAHATDPNGIAQ